MVKIQKISSIEPTLGFTEFDILQKYRQSFERSELGYLYDIIPFSELACSMNLREVLLGPKTFFSPEGKIALMFLKSYTNSSRTRMLKRRLMGEEKMKRRQKLLQDCSVFKGVFCQ